MQPVFRGSWDKLDRADHHYRELQSMISEFLDELGTRGDYLFTFEQAYNPRAHCIVYSLADVQPAIPEWGVALGDLIHNLRSSLDHAAWTLVCRGKKPPDKLSRLEERAVHFPISRDRVEFNESVRPTNPRRHPCLPGVGRVPLAMVRAAQPFRGPKAKVDMHPLAVLQQLSNNDKHRVVQLALFRGFDPEFTIGEAQDFEVQRTVLNPKILWPASGTEVLRIYGRLSGLNPYVDVDIRSRAEPAIEGRYWLGDTYQFTRDRIVALLYRLAPLVR